MEMDPAHLARGGRLTGIAIEHVRQGWHRVSSAAPAPGIFGTTHAAAKVDAALSRTHGHHLQMLGDHLGKLQWVSARATETASVFDDADRDMAGLITRSGSFEK